MRKEIGFVMENLGFFRRRNGRKWCFPIKIHRHQSAKSTIIILIIAKSQLFHDFKLNFDKIFRQKVNGIRFEKNQTKIWPFNGSLQNAAGLSRSIFENNQKILFTCLFFW